MSNEHSCQEHPFPWAVDRGNVFYDIDLSGVQTPCYIVHLGILEENLKKIKTVQDRTGTKVLLALKGFATHSTFPLIREYLDGISASSAWEAQLGRELFGKEV